MGKERENLFSEMLGYSDKYLIVWAIQLLADGWKEMRVLK